MPVLSLPQRAAELAAVEGYTVFVQDAEDGTAAVETAHRPDVIDTVATVVHRNDGLHAVFLRFHGQALGRTYVLLKDVDMSRCLA